MNCCPTHMRRLTDHVLRLFVFVQVDEDILALGRLPQSSNFCRFRSPLRTKTWRILTSWHGHEGVSSWRLLAVQLLHKTLKVLCKESGNTEVQETCADSQTMKGLFEVCKKEVLFTQPASSKDRWVPTDCTQDHGC